LYHGTRKIDPAEIYGGEEGFDIRYAKRAMWGKAIYFAANASYSGLNYHHTLPNQNSQIFYSRVLLGRVKEMPAN
jgi:hypothetical protein